MARLDLEARPSGGVRTYSLFVDGVPVTMDCRHRGVLACDGRCGDGSRHSLLYAFYGQAGATLSATVSCAGAPVCRVNGPSIGEQGAPRRAGRALFEI